MLYKIVRVSLRIIWVTLNNLYSFPSCFAWLFLIQPIRLLCPSLYWKMEGVLFNWMLTQVAHWIQSAGYKVVESGRDLTPYWDDEALVIVNHQSTADVPIIMNCFTAKRGVCAGMMWIMDRILMYSTFGGIALIHGDFFVQQGTKNGRSDQMNYLEKHINTVYQERPRKWIVLFPEGGFLRKRRERSQNYAKLHNLPVLTHVALPRLGAAQIIFNNLHPDSATANKKTIKWVIDMTIGYKNGKPLDIFKFMIGYEKPVPTHVYYRVYPVKDIPLDGEGMQQWLCKIYSEKEKLLSHFYETGHFPSQELDGDLPGGIVHEHVIKFSNVYLWSLHLFFLTSLIVQYYCVRYLLAVLF